jgi:hypothetical protein
MRAAQVTDPIAYHAEGPVWSSQWGGLRWVDMLAGDVLQLTNGTLTRTHVADIVAAVRPRRSGGSGVRCHARFRVGGCRRHVAHDAGTLVPHDVLAAERSDRMQHLDLSVVPVGSLRPRRVDPWP